MSFGVVAASYLSVVGDVIFADDFNRADGPVGNGWIDWRGGTDTIVSGALQITGYGGYGRVYQDNMPKNVSVRAVFASTIDDFQGIFMGYSATTNSGIKLFSSLGTWVVGNAADWSTDNTPISFINTPSTPYTSLRLDFDGTTITCYINDTIVHTTTPATLGITLDTNPSNIYQAGYCGETTDTGAHARIDSFEARLS